ncbi:sensor histidine kinase [Herbiconiux sp. P15]|uniref:sensor histidine kinase n=1 Tax=Herbiconiux liukaitaii TaxID=3342799 RepID=UPI0035B7DF0E
MTPRSEPPTPPGGPTASPDIPTPRDASTTPPGGSASSRATAEGRGVGARGEDALAAGAVFALGVLLVALGSSGVWSDAPRWLGDDVSPWVHLVPLAVGCGAMLLKRRLPISMLLVGVAAVVVDWGLGGSVAMIVVLFDLLYAATAYTTERRRRFVVRGAVAAVVAVGVVPLLLGASLQVAVLLALQTVALLLVPVWWALNVVQKGELAELAARAAEFERERADLERDRADALERVAAADRDDAVRAERARMARDLHDTIAGQLSVIAIRAEASLAHPADAERDRESLAVVRESAVRSLGEMRQMIGLLRDGDADPLATAPGLERLGELAEASRRAGIDVRVDPPWSFARVGPPTAVEQAAYRIVQESIVNAGKHATGLPVTVALRDDPAGERLVVESRNPLAPRPETGGRAGGAATGRSRGGGLGLVTMRERTLALGGVFIAGPSEGEWIVHAEFPTRALGGRA